ncbi:amidase [Rhodobacter maris]|uniref:Aspartyl-tRNA(Asn)/glutamyl-tRNA(Gln) amidotransferase subunit A n=1 Tax=Rhodobacter maris TaxID=446682 RepID=A0A285RMQ1_9RHOB|nr:amidase [Rhodobacter maris]SOB94978.1 aspartyl-tRNA(Asn)/glutamyl-tRNA(Gln) amidotransferase subunit A [Rhodobacter maris]
MLERFWSAAAQGRAMAEGRLDPVDMAEAYLEAAAPRPDIYARLTADRARFEAMAARTRLLDGLGRGPLDGVALSWKDLFDTAGTVTEAGSLLLAGRTPEHDAEVLENATLAGTVCLGKTHMTELAFSGLGLNPNTATPPNAVTRGLAPGGSSSGAAVSVKLGLAAAAVGSDTGGSVRIPAAWNDVVGLKTTHGRVPTRGVVPLCKRFDTVGPLARSVEDCALVLAALEGRAAPDLRGATLAGARLLVLDGLPFEAIRDAPAAGFAAAVQRLLRAGARIEHMDLPMVAPAMALSGVLFAPEAYGLWQDVIEAAPEKMYPLILQRFRTGAGVSAADYVKAWDDLERYRAEFQAAVAGYDAVLVPTAPILPPDALRLLTDPVYFETENLLALRNTRLANIFGLCALTLPTGEPMCGISLMGKPLREEALLRLGLAAEAALG